MSQLDPATPEGGAHRAWLRAEADRLLDWAAGSAHPRGGFGWRTRSGGLDAARGRPLWVGCRMVHCLSLGALLGRDDDRLAAAAGVRALLTSYRDAERGGWWADADRPGQGRKEAYGHAFVVLAGATATVADVPDGRALLDEGLTTYLARFWDDAAGMPFESYAVDWTDLEDYRGGNAAMHTVEAFLAAADATGDPVWRDRALGICVRMLAAAEAQDWRVPEHFDAGWRVRPDYHVDQPRHPFRPYGVTPGHAFEWARLVLTLRAGHPVPERLLDVAVALAGTAWADGWDAVQGGLVYTTDAAGVPVVRERFHWVACEALGAAWALCRATGDPRWTATYDEVAAFTERFFVDPTAPGAWWHELSESNERVQRTWVGAPDTYHALQAVLLPTFDLAPGLARSLARGRRSRLA